MVNIEKYLSENSYPGRGIIIGRSGENVVVAYFIMGRSENSRNRIFFESDGGIRTKAYDESKLSDPSLIIYAPVRVIDGMTIVTNGDQTDTVYDFINEGKSFEEALRTREFEPDSPNFTPRISGIVYPDGTFKMSILKSDDGDSSQCIRNFYEYSTPLDGQGRIIHTYSQDGNPIPSFEGEPKAFELVKEDIDSFASKIWNSLNEDNKVSLFVRYINIKDGSEQSKIINKNV